MLSPTVFWKVNHSIGPLSTDPFASRLSSKFPVFVRCLHSELEHTAREIICQSTLGPERQSPVAGTLPRSTVGDTGSLSLENSGMVSKAPHSTVTRHNTVSVSEQSTGHHPSVGHVGYIRQRCESSHFSQSATDLVLIMERQIHKVLQLPHLVAKWAHWCGEQNRNPFSSSKVM